MPADGHPLALSVGPLALESASATSTGLLVVSLAIGVVIGLTGMGGGALMTPALIVLGIPPTAAVANDLVVNAVNKVVGGAVHWRRGRPNLRIAMWLVIGSVPTSFAGGWLVHAVGAEHVQGSLKKAIGVTLILAAGGYVLRAYLRLTGRLTPGDDADPPARPLPTLLVGAVGGLMVGVTSVGSGTIIMLCIMLLYPTLSALRLVGTDIVQAVPLVLAAAAGHVLTTGVDWGLLWPLLLGGSVGTLCGAMLAPRVPESLIMRGLTIVLVVAGLAMLKLFPEQYLLLVAGALLIFGPLAWNVVRRRALERGDGPRDSGGTAASVGGRATDEDYVI